MNPPQKIVPFEQASAHFSALRAQGRRIVQCHGTFDLLHPGHIFHLEAASKRGDILVVTVTAAQFVNKGPGRPYFNDSLRLHTLEALACVDYVVLVPFPAAAEAIQAVRPHVYCKGREYADASNDVTGNIHGDRAAVASCGGVVEYLGDIVFSSTRLLNSHFDHLNPRVTEFCGQVAANCTPQDFAAAVENFSSLRVLVVGEAIFDRYTTVSVQGLTSKNRILSGRFIGEETHAGGALAVLRHVRQFTPHVRFLSLLGTEPWVDPLLRQHVPEDADRSVREPGFTSIVKQRFVEPLAQGKELMKLFAVNYIDAGPPPPTAITAVLERLRRELEDCDVVLLADFGHGLLQEPVRRLLEERAPFLALNCQTNSNNHGFNVINRRYRRTDIFTFDEQELLLACGLRDIDHTAELEKLRRHFGARAGWLTRGAVLTVGVDDQGGIATCPPLADEVTDTVGAGDAFFSTVALAAARRLPIDLATLIGQLAGAQAVRIVGNREPISKGTLLKGGMALLNRGDD